MEGDPEGAATAASDSMPFVEDAEADRDAMELDEAPPAAEASGLDDARPSASGEDATSAEADAIEAALAEAADELPPPASSQPTMPDEPSGEPEAEPEPEPEPEAAPALAANGGGGAGGAHDAADALATLASAALNRQNSAKESRLQEQEDPWYTVGIVKGTSAMVKSYIADRNIDLSKITLDYLPDLTNLPQVPLEPGTGYKFRIAAINSCGRGEFGEESAFKTCVPGYPGAPSSIKITKSVEGAHLSWEPPQVSSEGIFEYSVYLAVKPTPTSIVKDASLAKSQLTFVRVYCGKANTCVVSQATLGNAHVDNSAKPAIIFRIAARNDKGYGPATQVRWLQENKTTGVKRILADGRPAGAPATKQAKPNLIHSL